MRPRRSLALVVVASCSKDVETADPACASAKAYIQRLEVALDQTRRDLRVFETLEFQVVTAFANGGGDIRVRVQPLEGPSWRDVYGVPPGGAVRVRPDGHLVWECAAIVRNAVGR